MISSYLFQKFRNKNQYPTDQKSSSSGNPFERNPKIFSLCDDYNNLHLNPNKNLNTINRELAFDEQAADQLPYDKRFEFPRDRLQLGKQIGEGHFGVVVEGIATGILNHEDETKVAIKMVKQFANFEVRSLDSSAVHFSSTPLSTEQEVRALALELKILIHLGRHLNVVNLLGAVTNHLANRM